MKTLAIAQSLSGANIRQQPWCYVHRVWRHLPDHGIHGVIVSDGYPRLPRYEEIEGIGVHRVRSVRSLPGLGNGPLQDLVNSQQPDVVLWNVGLTSLLHLATSSLDGTPLVGLFTSPSYRLSEVLRMGPRRVASNFRDLYVHLLGAAIPRLLLSQALVRAGFVALIALTQEAKQALTRLGVPPKHIHVVSPGVDDEWLDATVDPESVAELRQKVGVGDTFQVLYLGSPSSLRGPDVLVRAVALARSHAPHIRLVLLCRRHPDEYVAEEYRLLKLIRDVRQDDAVHFVSAYLSSQEVRRWVAASDLVALPFMLVPSDAPISLLEAAAAGKPIVTTSVGGIPSLLPSDAVRLVPPGDAQALAGAILEAADRRDDYGSPQHRRWDRGWRDVTADVAAILHEVVKNG